MYHVHLDTSHHLYNFVGNW